MKAHIFLIGITLLAGSCQHKKTVRTETALIDADDFKAYATQTQPQEQWSSKARIKSLGGVYIPPPPIPSLRSRFGMDFSEAKKRVRILDLRNSDKFQESNFSMNKDVKAPVANINRQDFFDSKGNARPTLDAELSAKNISKDSIILLVCDSEKIFEIVDVLHALGYSRVLTFRETGEKYWQHSCQ